MHSPIPLCLNYIFQRHGDPIIASILTITQATVAAKSSTPQVIPALSYTVEETRVCASGINSPISGVPIKAPIPRIRYKAPLTLVKFCTPKSSINDAGKSDIYALAKAPYKIVKVMNNPSALECDILDLSNIDGSQKANTAMVLRNVV